MLLRSHAILLFDTNFPTQHALAMTEISSKWITSKLFSTIYIFLCQLNWREFFEIFFSVYYGMGLISVDNQVSWLYTPLRCHSIVFFANIIQPQLFIYIWIHFVGKTKPCFVYIYLVRRNIICNCLLSFQVINKWYFYRIHEIDIDQLKIGLKLGTYFSHDNRVTIRYIFLYPTSEKKCSIMVCIIIQPFAHNIQWRVEFLRIGGSVFLNDYEEISLDHKKKKFLGIK